MIRPAAMATKLMTSMVTPKVVWFVKEEEKGGSV
jgi:hypothetical protein